MKAQIFLTTNVKFYRWKYTTALLVVARNIVCALKKYMNKDIPSGGVLLHTISCEGKGQLGTQETNLTQQNLILSPETSEHH